MDIGRPAESRTCPLITAVGVIEITALAVCPAVTVVLNSAIGLGPDIEVPK
ncbi:MAG TPA: hypothetical protein VFO86_10125 [Terriglobia bacterium]|nr:hypothetical protein [Terriglobia bacterium]